MERVARSLLDDEDRHTLKRTAQAKGVRECLRLLLTYRNTARLNAFDASRPPLQIQDDAVLLVLAGALHKHWKRQARLMRLWTVVLRTMVFLRRWHTHAVDRMYAPGGVGYYTAEKSFKANLAMCN